MGNTDVKPVLFVWAGRQKWGQRPAVPMGHLGWPAEGGCGFAKGAARKTGPPKPAKKAPAARMDRPQSPDSARTSLAKTRGLRTHFFNFEKGTDREKGGADLGPGKFREIPGANSKQVAVASKWVSRNDSGCDLVVSGQMETLTKTI